MLFIEFGIASVDMINYEAFLVNNFDQWLSRKDDSWIKKYKPGVNVPSESYPFAKPRLWQRTNQIHQLRATPISKIFSTSKLHTPSSNPSIILSNKTTPEKPPSWEICFSLTLTTDYDPTFTTEYFEVRDSPKGGLGAFAIKKIKKDTVILIEEPLYRGDYDGLYEAYHNFTKEQTAAYLSLHPWAGYPGYDKSKVKCIFAANRFSTGPDSGIFLKSSRYNHACHPFATCTYRYDITSNTLSTIALDDIAKGQEITISYSPDPKSLYSNYGFYCDCPGCPPPKYPNDSNKAPFLETNDAFQW